MKCVGKCHMGHIACDWMHMGHIAQLDAYVIRHIAWICPTVTPETVWNFASLVSGPDTWHFPATQRLNNNSGFLEFEKVFGP